MTTEHAPDKEVKMLEIDTEASSRLQAEIAESRRKGYEVIVAQSKDKAYENPDRISAVFHRLRESDRVLERCREELRVHGIGKSIIDFAQRRARPATYQRSLYKQLEGVRHELLFRPTKSEPWHDQRGRAPALLTITSAYDLDDGSGNGIYQTMSGPLDDEVLEHIFDERTPELNKMSITEALEWTSDSYGRKRLSYEEVRQKAARRMQKMRQFLHAPVTPEFKEIVEYCTDSIGIRERRDVMHDTVMNHFDGQEKEGEKLLMSFGSGTALPMLEVLSDLKDRGVSARLILLDQDPLALASAVQLARKMGVDELIEVHCKRLFSRLGKPLRLDDVLQGRKLDVAEDSGLREYLDDRLYKDLAREEWSALKDGGLMVTGNMNVNRPQAEFLHGMMGWQPAVKMRTITENFTLHEDAGVPSGATRAVVTQSGVYTMLASVKKMSSKSQ